MPSYPIEQDSQGCYYYDDFGNIHPVPCGGGGSSYPSQNFPPIISGGVSTTGTSGGYIQQGQSWYNDLLNTILGLGAIGQGGTIQGGAINPQQQPAYMPQQYQQSQYPQNQSVVNTSSLGDFVSKNATWLLIGGAVYLLWSSGRKK